MKDIFRQSYTWKQLADYGREAFPMVICDRKNLVYSRGICMFV